MLFLIISHFVEFLLAERYFVDFYFPENTRSYLSIEKLKTSKAAVLLKNVKVCMQVKWRFYHYNEKNIRNKQKSLRIYLINLICFFCC